MSLDLATGLFVGLAFIMLMAGLLAFIFALAIFRYRFRKEVGLFKRHVRFRPKPPDRSYKVE